MELILPNTDNMIFNTSCMQSILLVFDIFLFVFLVLLTYTCLSAPRWSPYKSSPSPCTSLSGWGRNENSRKEKNFVNVASSALVVFSVLIIFTCNYWERGALAISNSLPWHHMRAEVHVAVSTPAVIMEVNLKTTLYCPCHDNDHEKEKRDLFI